MLIHLLLTILCGSTGVILLEKWKVDDYMNTHRFWSKYWPSNPCSLCRAFWIGYGVFVLLTLIPNSVYLLVPFAAIPIQAILNRLTLK
ncbi:hypothetical protein [Larkinella soli]|uniref:hypothetical protein n=1 Tax=Larkinella soli TaxID=1770527 RepID=UPI000FFBE130|nr:hypothetical protein [Larkinella soli]